MKAYIAMCLPYLSTTRLAFFLFFLLASQIWATPYLQQGKEMDSPLQKWLLAVLQMLGVGKKMPSWCVVHECGLDPYRTS